MSHNIKVAIKVRPLIKREKDENLPMQWVVQGNSIVSTDTEMKKRGDSRFSFDHIFDMNVSNSEVFDTIVKPIVDATVSGFNGTIFAYGQTSSGKTYTMMGNSQEPGIIPLAVDHMFNAIANTVGREFLLRVSYLEIYNEKVNDLLNKSGIDLKLKEDSSGQVILHCKEEITNCPENVLSIMKKGDKHRRIGETNMNERSSRSHTIFRITIESRAAGTDSDGAIQVSQLNLVDLAGSERARQTGATGERFKEGRHINMSLSALGLVIMQLSESQDKKYINYRDNKLTRLLQNSLGGNAMTTIICAVTPASLEETQCTLSFASRAKSVRNKPQVNEVMSGDALLKRYAKQLSKLQAELKKIKNENRSAEVEEMESKLQEKDRINQLLEERIELLKTRIVSGDTTIDQESFKCKSKRRQTWGGPGIFNQQLLVVSSKTGSPPIKEMSFEKPHRKSIIQSVDIMNESFQTAFTDFELELLESERDRMIGDDASNNEEELFITKRKKHRVTFKDDVFTIRSESSITPEEYTTPEKCNISTQTTNCLTNDYDELSEYTTLEKQLLCSENYCSTYEEKLRNKIKFIPDVKEQLDRLKLTKGQNIECIITELCVQLKEAEEQRRLDEDAKQKLMKYVGELQTQVQGTTSERNEFEDRCELRAQLKAKNAENMEEEKTELLKTTLESRKRNDCDYIKENDDFKNCVEDLQKVIANMQIENQNLKDQLKDQLISSFRFNESDADFSSLMMTEKSQLEETLHLKSQLEETLHLKSQELEEVRSIIQSFKTDIENLQETICILTTENMEMSTKLTTEQENAKQAELNLQKTIDELYTRISEVTNQKIKLESDLVILKGQLESIQSRATETFSEKQLLTKYQNKIDELTTENIELSGSIAEKNRELENIKESRSLLYDHECIYKDKLAVLTEKNEYLLSENNELSTDLIDKIEESDSLKEQCDILKNKVEQLLTMKDDCLGHDLERIRSENNILKAEIIELKAKITILSDENTKFSNNLLEIMENLDCPYNEKSFNNTSNLSTIFDDTTNWTNESLQEVFQEKSHEVLLDQMTTLQDKIKHLTRLNKKLSDLKLTSCSGCAGLKVVNKSRRTLKIEVKALNKKLEDLQRKFNQKCADTEMFKSKINTELISNVQSNSSNVSFVDETNVSFVEEKIQTLNVENHIDQLRDSINDLKKNNATFTTMSDQFKQEKANLLDEISSLKISYEELQKTATEKMRIFEDHLSNMSKEIERCLIQEKSQRLMLEVELEDLKVKEQDKNSLINQLHEHICSLKHELDLITTKNNELVASSSITEYRYKEELEHLKKQYEDLEKAKLQSTEIEQHSTFRIQELEACIDTLQKNIVKQECLCREFEEKSFHLEKLLQESEQEKCILVQKAQTVETDLLHVRNNLEIELRNEFDSISAQYELRIKESETNLQKLNNTLNKYVDDNLNLTQELKRKEEEMKRKSQNIEELTVKLEQLEEAYNKINYALEQKTSSNNITEDRDIYNQTLKELDDLKSKYELVLQENAETKNALSVYKSKYSISSLTMEEDKYNALVLEKNKIVLELEEKELILNKKDAELEKCTNRIQQLTGENKELDDELEEYAKLIQQQDNEIANLQDKLNSRLTENNVITELQQKLRDRGEENEKLRDQVEGLKMRLDIEQSENCKSQLETVIRTLQKENLELRTKLNDCKKSSTEIKLINDLEEKLRSLEEENAKLRNGIREYQIKLKHNAHNEKTPFREESTKKQLRITMSDKELNEYEEKYQQLKKKIHELELQLVSKNGKIATLEIHIQCEEFPYKKKCKDLEEHLLAFRNKNAMLDVEVRNLQKTINDVNTWECEICRRWRINRKDQACQTIPNNLLRFCSINSGVVAEDVKMRKLEKETILMKNLCRSKSRRIEELEDQIKELEAQSSVVLRPAKNSGMR